MLGAQVSRNGLGNGWGIPGHLLPPDGWLATTPLGGWESPVLGPGQGLGDARLDALREGDVDIEPLPGLSDQLFV